MAITDAKKVDLLWKKIGFGKAKTDTNAAKKAANESIVSEFIIKPTSIWSDTSSIASTKPSANAGITIVYDELETTEDGTSTARRTWKTGVINWIPPTFGATYQLKVYVDSAGSGNPASNGAQLFEMLIFELPSRVRLHQSQCFLVGSATRQLAVSEGEVTRPPLAERLNVCTAFFGKHVGIKMVAPVEQGHFQL